MPGVADAWSAQNTMTRQLKMLSTVADQLAGETSSLVPMPSMNYSELFRNMSLDVYYWIGKDTHLLKKTDVLEIFTVAPQSLGLRAGNETIANETLLNETMQENNTTQAAATS